MTLVHSGSDPAEEDWVRCDVLVCGTAPVMPIVTAGVRAAYRVAWAFMDPTAGAPRFAFVVLLVGTEEGALQRVRDQLDADPNLSRLHLVHQILAVREPAVDPDGAESVHPAATVTDAESAEAVANDAVGEAVTEQGGKDSVPAEQGEKDAPSMEDAADDNAPTDADAPEVRTNDVARVCRAAVQAALAAAAEVERAPHLALTHRQLEKLLMANAVVPAAGDPADATRATEPPPSVGQLVRALTTRSDRSLSVRRREPDPRPADPAVRRPDPAGPDAGPPARCQLRRLHLHARCVRRQRHVLQQSTRFCARRHRDQRA
jgi:hypothetical protein